MAAKRLEPLCEGISDIQTTRGRYEVQLEIPNTSTLTKSEVERILRISSWDTDPNKAVEGFEGGRSVLLRREHPIKIGKIELAGLQISGVGHTGIRITEDGTGTTGNEFHPPSSENFMKRVPGTFMSTGHAEGKELKQSRPTYRALGTYTDSELSEKVRKTQTVSSSKLENMVVPHIEAYGRYLNVELRNEEGQFGFIVFPVPDPKKPRAAHEFMNSLEKSIPGKTYQEALKLFHYGISAYISALAKGLRELHDVTRMVHLQPHLENLYLMGSIPYVVDWSTSTKLGSNSEENIINRAIDLKRPSTDYNSLLSRLFHQIPEHIETAMRVTAEELVLEAYSGLPGERVDFLSLDNGSPDITEFDAIMFWLKRQGFEGYKDYPNARPLRKVGRNESCPCGSGKKYKRCCG